ncbi:MAG: FAD-binding oxidoreductase, partial [Anaerolineaceae bacterium]|nr:FAD-binding oxidoreductase [Anaerolineaceae bacterium]
AVKGGIALDMSKHMNKVVKFNEMDQTITVQAGMTGPQLEDLLNHAKTKLNAKRAYSCGHFPQSFEYSSVGGWVVTRGAGQNSTYYGKIEDIVIAQEYVTPRGVFKTLEHPRSANGPDFDQIMMGSEGAFGVLTNVTLKVFRWQPENRKRYSYMFKNWQDAREACREIMQAEFGLPSVFRLSDPEETDVAMKLYHIEGTIADSVLKVLGYQPMQKCLLLGHTDGERGFSANVDRKIRRICRKYGAFELSFAGVTKNWEHGRFRDPYMREDLQDFGILIDTLECSVTWSQMENVHKQVRAFIKNRPQTVCMTHLSHAYPQGGNLYFIFIVKSNSIKEYLDLQYGVLDAIQKSGAALSHHHGVGKQSSPWLEDQIGTPQMDVIRCLKQHFDPHNIMNPGGTLGLDMSADQRARRWSKDLED